MIDYKFPLEPETDDRDGGGSWEGAFPAHANGGHLYKDWSSFKALTIAEATALSVGAHPEAIFDFLSKGGTLQGGLYASIMDGLVRAVLSGDIKTAALDTPIFKSDVTSETLVITQDVYNYFESKLKKEKPRATIAQEKNNHQSDQLKILNQASEKFWANADPSEKETHPINKNVSDWLIDNGFSSISAQQGAAIIRPEWAAKGRRITD